MWFWSLPFWGTSLKAYRTQIKSGGTFQQLNSIVFGADVELLTVDTPEVLYFDDDPVYRNYDEYENINQSNLNTNQNNDEKKDGKVDFP